jgi:hypothetical protein
MEEIMSAVSTVGFPIAVACYTLYMNYKLQTTDNKKAIKATEEHTKVLSELKILIETLVRRE